MWAFDLILNSMGSTELLVPGNRPPQGIQPRGRGRRRRRRGRRRRRRGRGRRGGGGGGGGGEEEEEEEPTQMEHGQLLYSTL